MLFFVVLLFFTYNKPFTVIAVEMIEHFHNVAVATVLLIKHYSEIARNFLIQRFEETFFI